MKLFIVIMLIFASVDAKYKKNTTIEIPDYYAKYAIKLGEDSAPIKIIQLFAIHCSSCKATHHRYFQKMKEKYIDSYKIQWIFLPYASDLDTLFWMAAQDRFSLQDQIKILDKVFEQTDHSSLKDIFTEFNLSENDLEYIFTQKNHTKLLEIAKKFQKYVNVDGTPTFYMNGNEIEDIPTLEDLEQHIQEISQ